MLRQFIRVCCSTFLQQLRSSTQLKGREDMSRLIVVPQFNDSAILGYGACVQAQIFRPKTSVTARTRHFSIAGHHGRPISRAYGFGTSPMAYKLLQAQGQDNPIELLPNLPAQLNANARPLNLPRHGHRNDRPGPRKVLSSVRNPDTVGFPEFNGGNDLQWHGCEQPRPGLAYKTFISGNGKIATAGDKVIFRLVIFKYDRQSYTPEYYENSCSLTLGSRHYGEGFDLGIIGMKLEERRRLAIRKDLDRPPTLLQKMGNFVGGQDSWKVYDVTLIKIN